jgi:hypothetical protein
MLSGVVSSSEVPGGGRLEGFEGPHLRLDGELVEGFEAIDRSDFYDPRGGDAYAFSVAATSTAWFVAVHVGGLWRSTDRGATWAQVVPTKADVHHVIADEDEVVVVAAAAGVAVSSDGGATFEPWRTDGLAHGYCTAVARSGAVLVVGSSDGPFGETVLYRGALDGGGFERTGAELPTAEPVLARQLLEGDAAGFRYQGRTSADGQTWVADA